MNNKKAQLLLTNQANPHDAVEIRVMSLEGIESDSIDSLHMVSYTVLY